MTAPAAGNAIVCGTAPDGLALAITLGNAGWNVRVICDEPQRSCLGYVVELDVEASLALEQLSMGDKIGEARELVSSVRWVDARGRAIAGLSDDDAAVNPAYVPHDALAGVLLDLSSTLQMEVRRWTVNQAMRPGSI